MSLSKNSTQSNKTRLLDDYQQDVPELSYPRNYYASSGILVPKRKFKAIKFLPSKFASNPHKIVKFGYLLCKNGNIRANRNPKNIRFNCILDIFVFVLSFF